MKGFLKYFSKFVVVLVAVMIPAALCFADIGSEGGDVLGGMFKKLSFHPSQSDLSVAFLGKMFGSVPGVPELYGLGTSILGTIFNVFNAGVFALSGVFLSYKIGTILTETTMDGAAMGKSTTMWTAVRCALSTSLLVPQASGYSMINGIVMWVVMQGIGLADITWGRALEYLKEGHHMTTPKTHMVDYSLINSDLAAGNFYDPGDTEQGKQQYIENVGSADVLRSLVCAYTVYAAIQSAQKMRHKMLSAYTQKQWDALKGSDLKRYNALQKEFNLAYVIPDMGTGALGDNPAEVDPNLGGVDGFGDFFIYQNMAKGDDVFKGNGYFLFPYIKDEQKYYIDNYGNQVPYANVKVLFGGTATVSPGKKVSPLSKYLYMDNPGAIPKHITGLCGAISYNLEEPGAGTTYTETDSAFGAKVKKYVPAKLAGLQRMIAILAPVAQKIVQDKKYRNKGEFLKYMKEYKLREGRGLFTDTNKKEAELFQLANLTSNNWLKDTRDYAKWLFTDAQGSKSIIKWPDGADALLQAAIEYQTILAPVQLNRTTALSSGANEKFDAARREGWISAGGYYRLLFDLQGDATKEYGYYKLVGYNPQSNQKAAPFGILNKVASGGGSSPYRDNASALNFGHADLFGWTFVSTDDRSKTISFFDLGVNYNDVLDNALKWIYIMYPYAKLKGQYVDAIYATKAMGKGSDPGMDASKDISGIYGDKITHGMSQGISARGRGAGIDTGVASDAVFKAADRVAPYVSDVATDMQAAAYMLKGVSIVSSKIGEAFSDHPTLAEIWIKVAAGALLISYIPEVVIPMPALAIPILLPIPLDFLNYDVNRVKKEWTKQMGSNKDPILKLKNLGNTMMSSSADFVVQMGEYFSVLHVAIGISQTGAFLSTLPASVATAMGIAVGAVNVMQQIQTMLESIASLVQAIVFMYVPLGMAVIGPMFIMGATLAIYVPMIPYMLFLFGVISWLISVLVLMAAAPLICFLMLWGTASSENPLLAREAEQFVMQLVSAFFRPTLMIIGLIAGMVLSYIGVDVLNIGFAHLYEFVVGKDTGGNIALVKEIAVFAVYTFTMVSIINMCYSPIYMLYSEAMRVANIQAPATGMEERQLEAIKGTVKQVSEAASLGGKEVAGGLKPGLQRKPKGKDEDGKGKGKVKGKTPKKSGGAKGVKRGNN